MSETQRGYLAFVGLGLIWGMSFLFFKLGVQDMSPTVLVFVRALSGTVTLVLIMRASGRPFFGRRLKSRLGHFALMAAINMVLPWTLIAWGEESISSGLASILNSTTPLWAAILIFWVIPSERPTFVNYIGVVLGVLGVVILVIPDLAAEGLSGTVIGAIAVVVSAVSYALAAVYQRAKLRGVDVFDQSAGQLFLAAVIALPLAVPSMAHVHVAWLSMGAVIALGAGGSGVAYLLYYYMINTLGAVRATGVTFIVPITAVLWGVVLLHESLSLAIVVGMAVILVGIVLTNWRKKPAVVQPQVEREQESLSA